MIQKNYAWWKIFIVALFVIPAVMHTPASVVQAATSTPTRTPVPIRIEQVDSNGNAITTLPVLNTGAILRLYIKISNSGSSSLDSVGIDVTGSCDRVSTSVITGNQSIPAGGSAIYIITASASSGANTGVCDDLFVDPTEGANTSLRLLFTVNDISTPTPGPPDICDETDPPSDISGAPRLYSNAAIEQGICFAGDVDTYALPMNRDKVYDIYISKSYIELTDGTKVQSLDLVIELYDPLFRLVTISDDFYAHNSSDNEAVAIDPKIANYRAPMDGTYYVRVRDATGASVGYYTLNFNNLSYRGDAANNNDDTVPNNSGVCQDLYEPDGLPEQARMILSNQRQTERRLCPTGDADWVKFFAKAGNTYMLYTSTEDNTAGVDTYISLFDRDGFTLLDTNDNYEASSLDSKVVFTATSDGFYFAQIKNTGDLGGPFFTYALINEVCNELNQSTCVADLPEPEPTPTQTPDGTDDGTGNEDDFEYGDESDQDPESDVGFFTTSVRPTGELFNGPLQGFVNTAFESLWNRTERPIVRQQVNRGWVWGPAGLMAHAESFLQISGGQRQVQYFDKGRMEINNPNGDRQSKWFVTSGLLVTELISGRMQVGANDYIAREPSGTIIAGDIDNTLSPTYASLNKLLGLRTINRAGQVVDQQILRDGSVIPFNGDGASMTQLVYYVDETGHNIPQVFYEYLTRKDTVYVNGRTEYGLVIDWVHTMGYPLTEAYWTRTAIGGVEQWVLIQPFERRLLTYVPSNQASWQVEQGNVGRHYYRWRYGIDP
ncbi:MAG: hypothetical protein RI985_1833 [Chloroflexota bacterium]|jgi:hypothetical protein